VDADAALYLLTHNFLILAGETEQNHDKSQSDAMSSSRMRYLIVIAITNYSVKLIINKR
jgi:hypothetical protein